jgi:pullulanase/glycogen debranching enzyme
MPIHPIGEIKRKAEGDLFVSQMPDIEQSKYLGSPYSVQDYKAVNPDYGTTEDFKELVEECHKMGFKVILDWVANHTAWDHAWITDHPEWYTTKDGKITDPLNKEGNSMGWTDVADLNYNDQDLHTAMVNDMVYWVKECDIDGFRCDVAFEVPAEFWRSAIDSLRSVKDVFMLAEAQDHNMDLYEEGMFDAYYSWSVHHFMNELAQDKIDAAGFAHEWAKVDSIFGDKAVPLNFITNHDENTWNGTVFERMNDRWKAMAVLSYMIKGIPLNYSGQEVGLDHRLPFFEKDTIDWNTENAKEFTQFYKQLNDLKTDLNAFTKSEVNANDGVLSITRGSYHLTINTKDVNVKVNPSISSVMNHRQENGELAPWGFTLTK